MIRNTARPVGFTDLLSAALSTGAFFRARASLGLSSKSFVPTTYVEVQQATILNLRPVMGALLPEAVAANLAVLALSLRERCSTTFALTLIGFRYQLASLARTGLFELPINGRLMTRFHEDTSKGWEALRDRWDDVHTAKTALSVAGLGCLVAAPLTSAERSDSAEVIDRKGCVPA